MDTRNKNGIKNRLLLAGSFLSLTVTLIAVIMAAGYIFNRSFGWFAPNARVSGSTGGTNMNGALFELAVVEDADQQTSYPYEESGTGVLNFLSLSENGGYKKIDETGSEGGALFARFVNQKSGSADERVKPGDFGVISFDIIPTGNTCTAFTVSLSTVALTADDDDESYGLSVIDPSEDAARFLKGHIMFFLGRTAIGGSGEYYYHGFLENGSFVIDTANETPVYVSGDDRAHYRVNVYWIWPSTFAQIAFEEGDFRLHTRSLFGSSASQAAERASLLAYIAEHGTNANNGADNYYFSGCQYDFVDGIGMENTYYLAFSDGYNDADQIIGDNIKYFAAAAQVAPAQ